MDDSELHERLKKLNRRQLEMILYYAYGYSPQGVMEGLALEERTRPAPVITDDGDEDGPMDDEAELRRADAARDEDGPCMKVGCGHGYDDHSLDLERGDRLYCQRCECRQFLSAAAMRVAS